MRFKIYGVNRETGKEVSGKFVGDNAKDAARQATDNCGWTISHVRISSKIAEGLEGWSIAVRIIAIFPAIYSLAKYSDMLPVVVAGFMASFCVYIVGPFLVGMAELIAL